MGYLYDKEVLITGGTGSLGKTLVKVLIKDRHLPRGIRIFSRDEQKHYMMEQEMKEYQSILKTKIPIAYTVGDVRDFSRLTQAMENVDVVIHTAAMKHIPVCEDNPLEAIHTNVTGSANVVRACLDRNVERAMFVSTDKAVHPINLYGFTKGAAEKLFIHANIYSGRKRTRFAVCRYGNVLGSKGSVVPMFLKLIKEKKPLPVTHIEMTRFWITLPTVARFLIDRIGSMAGREIFIPRMNALPILEMIKYITSEENPRIDYIGMRPGEKLHECLIAPEETAERVCSEEIDEEYSDYYYRVGIGGLPNKLALYSNSQENESIDKKEFEKMLQEEV